MSTLLDIARRPLAALAAYRRAASDPARHSSRAGAQPTQPSDPYEHQRSLRLLQLEADGKCLARPGKHDNLRYWPSEYGSRVLHEHRRRQPPRAL